VKSAKGGLASHSGASVLRFEKFLDVGYDPLDACFARGLISRRNAYRKKAKDPKEYETHDVPPSKRSSDITHGMNPKRGEVNRLIFQGEV
jgi:hypothetical protein